MKTNCSRVISIVRGYSAKAGKTKTPASTPLFLNPHAWKGLPADQVFELHQIRKEYMGDAYNSTDDERTAILSTISSLSKDKPPLDYAFEIENFKERLMNNTPMQERGKPQKLSAQFVINSGEVPHQRRRIENLTRTAAYEIPLLAKYRQPYTPRPRTEAPLKLTYNSDFSNDTSNPNNRKVTLTVALKDLQLDAKQEHKFKILAADKFNYKTNTFRLKGERYPEAAQNVNWLVETFSKLLTEAKDLSKEDFSDIPLSKSHMKRLSNKSTPQFPDHWKRPEDAPTKRHEIVKKLVSDTEAFKDATYLKEITP